MPASQRQQLYYNVTGQTLVFDAPSRPSSITSATVYHRGNGDDGTSETATTGSAAVETNPNTTFDAASGVSSADPTLLNIAATTGIAVGRQYLATDAEGRTEWIEIKGFTAGASAIARTPMHLDYVSGDTLEGTRCSISVLDAWIQDSGNISESDINAMYRVKWVWVDAGSVTHIDYTDVDVVRYRGAEHGVTPADMELFLPKWQSMVPDGHRGDGGQSLIDAATKRVELDLFALEVPGQQIRNRDMIGEVVKYATQRQLAWVKYMSGGDREMYDAADVEYQGVFDRVFRVETRIALDVDEDGATNLDASPGGIWKR